MIFLRSDNDYTFDELDFDVVKIAAATEKAPSRAVCERLEMTLEGVSSHAENIDVKILDHDIYAYN